MNRIFWLIGVMLLTGTVVGVGFGFNNSTAPTHVEPAGPPAVMAVGYVDGEFGVSKLYPLQSGRLVKALPEGSPVKKGEPILWLDEEMAASIVSGAKADLDASMAQELQAQKLPMQHKLQLDGQTAKIDATKLRKLGADNELTAKLKASIDVLSIDKNLIESYRQKVQELDQLVKAEEAKLEEIKLVDPKIDLTLAAANVAAKKARLDQATWALNQCKLVAPTDGTVLRVHVNPGEILGSNPNRPAVEFLPKGDLIVRGEVLQEWANRVKVGQEVDITDDTYQGPTYQGKVYFLSPWFTQKRNLIIEPFMYNDVRFLECLVRISPENEASLRVGQRVRVKIKS